jgi:hypothetical protein
VRFGPDDSHLDPYQIAAGTLWSDDSDYLRMPAGYEQAGRVVMQHVDPLPCTVTALMPQLVTEDRS